MSKTVKRLCPACGKTKEFRADCKTCGCRGSNPRLNQSRRAAARILVLDIETAGVNALNADLGFIVNFGYQFINGDGPGEPHMLHISDYPGWWKRGVGLDDRRITEEIVKVMRQADLYVAHYGKKFDLPYITSRCVYHQILPPPPNEIIDPCYIVWKNLKLSSARLKNMGNFLQLVERKMDKDGTKWPDWWHAVLAGSKKQCEEMGKYCLQDVKTLTEEYLRLRSYDRTAPRLHDVQTDAVGDALNCGVCGSKRLVYSERPSLKRRYQYRQFQCLDCGAWDRNSKRIK